MKNNPHEHPLLKRLDAIGQSLARSGHALALIGLGSVGLEQQRLDEWSDLDFFAIVEPGYKQAYIENLDWLLVLGPAAYYFRNTPDGYKFLYADRIYCEFAVFEPDELEKAVYPPGRMVWKRADVPDGWAVPRRGPKPPEKSDPAWLLGEALTNLYVGLGRDRRGEKLTALRYIQSYAVDRLLQLVEQTEIEQGAGRDDFDINRRFEQRYPAVAVLLPGWMQGYERNRESALAILAFLESRFEVPTAMAAAIRSLAGE